MTVISGLEDGHPGKLEAAIAHHLADMSRSAILPYLA
jgi:hypothetical protein